LKGGHACPYEGKYMFFNKNRFQKLKSAVDKLNRVHLINSPTPVHELKNLSEILGGPRIMIKRDDLTGLAFGGNKSRMFEFVLSNVLDKGYDTVIAGASVQSNYCRQMAAACAQLGLDTHLILREARGKKNFTPQGNLLLDLLIGVEITILKDGTQDEQKKAAEALSEKLKKKGKKPYIARVMNKDDLGIDAVGYTSCLIELTEQLQRQRVKPDYLYAASGDTTHAGLLFGAEFIESNLDIIAFNPVDKNFLDQIPEEIVFEIADKITEVLNIDFKVNPERIFSSSDYIGEGYGALSDKAREAIKLVAKTEGIFLDPVYTGKAMAGLIDHIKKGRLDHNDTVVFLHTGGTPALFAYADDLDVKIKK